MTKNHFGRKVRNRLRGLVLDAMTVAYRSSGRHHVLARQPAVSVLLLHHVYQDERAPFRKLLRFFQQTHEFVAYSEAVERIHRGDITKPYLTDAPCM